MINLNLNGISNTLNENNFLNVSVNLNRKKEEETVEPAIPIVIETPTFKDRKTTLETSDIELIKKIKDDVIVYLFIQKEKDYSAWSSIAPVIIEKGSGKTYQYRSINFALEGAGGGLSSTSSLFYYLRKHIEKGFQVLIAPKVTDNSLMKAFEYVDSGVKLNDLLDKSIDLHSYRKHSFEYIYQQYQELITKHKLEE
ncbi:hypothetical protein [Flavobacterium hydatis]|uniref:Uncharacterized protein n=1 Tax=Flavobacterium hydatis TaxID=991 RepID=A0A086A385_FLAHY|nr:hypothetical protein [Flavobacterium hydatis]KFF11149.1 hypothetical protein IW20_19590 [Flavobacterium hydatis]OXA97807.1 hypothetical protein B0A62_02830 [Flavobacterium hydatis]